MRGQGLNSNLRLFMPESLIISKIISYMIPPGYAGRDCCSHSHNRHVHFIFFAQLDDILTSG